MSFKGTAKYPWKYADMKNALKIQPLFKQINNFPQSTGVAGRDLMWNEGLARAAHQTSTRYRPMAQNHTATR